jgi:hypothetical protein
LLFVLFLVAAAMGSFAALGRCVTAGMEKFIAGVVTGMAILAAIGGAHLFMATHTSEVVGSFQADLICVINGIFSFKLLEII